jgi:uncharacterized protein with von Willebrand factor type A (vWA) domain
MGNEITRALPQELVQLSHPVLKYDMYRKMHEKQLLQYELEMNEERGEGAIICLVDDSGSMYPYYEPIARGIMFGLMKCAEKDKRNFACDIFSSSYNNFYVDIPKGKPTPKNVIDLLTVSFEGGTNYEKPLNFAMNKIKGQGFKDADIVLITDGECDLSQGSIEMLNKFKGELDFKVSTILINGGGCYVSDNLKKWSDYVYQDLKDETLTEVYKSM